MKWPDNVPVHPAAALFPLMDEATFGLLTADISVSGLREPIVRTAAGVILDGRNRLLACAKANKPPRFVVYTGEPCRFVVTANIHRHDFTNTERAVLAARLVNLGERPLTRTEAAALMRISRTSLERAHRVQAKGIPRLNAAVDTTQVRLSTADRVASLLAPSEQEEFMNKIDGGMTSRFAAPPPEPAAPSEVRKRLKPIRDVSVIGAPALATLAQDMTSIDVALRGVMTADPATTAAQCAQWARDIRRGTQALFRLRKILTSHHQVGEPQP
jgi:hypothetical protein